MSLLEEATEPFGLDTGDMRDFSRRRGPPSAHRFLAGGRLVAIIGYGGFLEIWDTAGGWPVTLHRIDGRPAGVNTFDASPNGDRVLLGTRDAGLQILDLKGRELRRLSLPPAAAAFFSAEPAGVASSSGDKDAGEDTTWVTVRNGRVTNGRVY